MSWESFKLPDGRTVRPHHRDAGMGMVGSDQHSVEFAGDQVAVINENGREVYRGPVPRKGASQAARRPGGGGPRSSRSGGQRPAGALDGDAGRWATLNAFVDTTMVDLTRVEALTWMILFRDARNGTVRTGMADIARRAGCSKRAVVDAVRSLTAKGLLRVVRRGRKNAGPSVYQVTPDVVRDTPASH